MSPIRSTITPPTDPNAAPNVEGHVVLNLLIDDPAITTMAGALAAYSTPTTVMAGYPQTLRTKTLQFSALPDVLTLALSRFRPTAGGGQTKIQRLIFANDPLTIPDACLTPELLASRQGVPAMYRLLHVVNHYGATTGSGHYRSYGMLASQGGPGTGDWYRHDATNYPFRRTVPGDIGRLTALHTGYIYVYVKIQ